MRIGTLGASGAALLMGLLLLFGLASVWVIIALVLALGSAMAFTITVRQTFTYDIVGQHHALNGLALGAMAMQGGGIVGSLASGAMIDLLGAGWQFIALGGLLSGFRRYHPGDCQSGPYPANVLSIRFEEPGLVTLKWCGNTA